MPVLFCQTTVSGLIPNTIGAGTGLTQQEPVQIYIATNDTLATVTTAGYLTKYGTQFAFNKYQMALVQTSDVGPTWLRVTTTAQANTSPIISLVVPTEGSGTFSTITLNAGTAAAPSLNFTGDTTTGLYLSSNGVLGIALEGVSAATFHTASRALIVSTASGGGIQAGQSGTAGQLYSYPATPTTGYITLKGASNAADFSVTVQNASFGQSSVLTIPDPGGAAANFILSTAGSAQTIAGGLTLSTGNLGVTAGTITSSGNIQATSGNVTAGSSGHAGTVTSFPGTAANGTLVLAAVNNAGGFNATISNKATLGQTTVYTLADPGAGTGTIPVSSTVSTIKMVSKAVVAGGAAAQTVTDAAVASTSVVTAYWNDTTTPCEIETIAPGNGSFVVTSTADPGASHISYVVYN